MKHDFENPMGITGPKGDIRMMSELLNLAVFPGTQGGPLEHVIAAKAVSFFEIMQDEFTTYAKQIIANTQAMSRAFTDLGYNIVSGGSDNHLLLIDLRNKNISGKKAENALVKADITVNKNMVPFDDKSPFITSGIRVGLPALTTRGLTTEHMPQLVDWINHILTNPENDAIIQSTRHEINTFMKQFPLYDNWVI
jgi:glycine hydroxymethyltransferase